MSDQSSPAPPPVGEDDIQERAEVLLLRHASYVNGEYAGPPDLAAMYALFRESQAARAAERRQHAEQITEKDRQLEGRCILDCDSPSYPPDDDERRQCSCVSCLNDLRRSAESREATLRAELEGTDPLSGDPTKWGLRTMVEGLTAHLAAARQEIETLKQAARDPAN